MKEWGIRHPWLAALVSGVILFVVLTPFRIFALEQETSSAVAQGAAFAATFAIFSGAMQSYRNRRGQMDAARIRLALLTFIVVLLLTFPSWGFDSDPPHHFNVFNQEIANDSGLIAIALAAISAGLVWIAARLHRS